MTVRTKPTAATEAANASLDLLEGEWKDRSGAPKPYAIETERGTWTVYAGPVSLATIATVQRLLAVEEGEDVPLENMVDVVIALARTVDGDPMFRAIHRDRLLNGVDPMYVLDAAQWLAGEATANLGEVQEAAGKG